MKQGRTDRDWVVVALMCFAAGAFFVWALMSGGSRTASWVPKDLPAWVQAIGSIAAILVAVSVPYWQRKQEIHDKRAQESLVARSYGLILLGELEKMGERIERDIAEFENDANAVMIGTNKDTIPRALWERGESLHLLGPAGGYAISAIHAIHRARAYRERPGIWVYDEHFGQFLQCMYEARSFCHQAIASVKGIL